MSLVEKTKMEASYNELFANGGWSKIAECSKTPQIIIHLVRL